MRTFQFPQIAELTTAIAVGYPQAAGQASIKLTLNRMSIDFDRWVVPNATFELTLNSILLNLNQTGELNTLLDKLTVEARPAVTRVIAAMLATPPPPQAAGFEELSRARLIIEGYPFVDHEILATAFVPRLMNRIDPLRAVVMTGPTDSGKTFSLGLIRQLCRDAPLASRFRPVVIDLVALALTRDCMDVARTVGSSLRLNHFELPRMDTSEPRIGRRLVEALSVARELSELAIVPTILIFDHLDKDVSSTIIDFVEELALAATDGRLQDLRVVLIGFPRASATTFGLGRLESDIVVQPNPALLFEYIDRALEVLDRDLDDQVLQSLVNGVFAGQQQPYPRTFMLELPTKIWGVLHDIIRAPTT